MYDGRSDSDLKQRFFQSFCKHTISSSAFLYVASIVFDCIYLKVIAIFVCTVCVSQLTIIFLFIFHATLPQSKVSEGRLSANFHNIALQIQHNVEIRHLLIYIYTALILHC